MRAARRHCEFAGAAHAVLPDDDREHGRPRAAGRFRSRSKIRAKPLGAPRVADRAHDDRGAESDDRGGVARASARRAPTKVPRTRTSVRAPPRFRAREQGGAPTKKENANTVEMPRSNAEPARQRDAASTDRESFKRSSSRCCCVARRCDQAQKEPVTFRSESTSRAPSARRRRIQPRALVCLVAEHDSFVDDGQRRHRHTLSRTDTRPLKFSSHEQRERGAARRDGSLTSSRSGRRRGSRSRACEDEPPRISWRIDGRRSGSRTEALRAA